MTLTRIQELKIEAKNERLSWGELGEIDHAGIEAGLDVTEMTADDVLTGLEAKIKDGEELI